MVVQINVKGLVQGVGFRPFIYRLAREIGIKGTVDNRNTGVVIQAEATRAQLDLFKRRIREEKPEVANILSVEEFILPLSTRSFDFKIIPSKSVSGTITRVSPDIAVCESCLQDMKKQPHRIRYPFINCTHCGPRFSIIRELPYDREQTTMRSFQMCPTCQTEYHHVADRRFHAQPVACNDCGPVYYCYYQGTEIRDYRQILDLSLHLLHQGKVIAVKGTGGYHLVCDASNETAVTRLRQIKQRDAKPFAVMFKNRDVLSTYVDLSHEAESELLSWRRPILLLPVKKPLAPSVNAPLHTLGCMLPYMPLHYHWFEQTTLPALVMTSGNQSGFPIAATRQEAKTMLAAADLIIHHNREIYNRVDDSVVQLIGSRSALIRRSRGYAPEPFETNIDAEGILAMGAEMQNTFALGKREEIIASQYIGDLKDGDVFRFYTQSIYRFQHLFQFTPRLVVCDMHPGYLSTREAQALSQQHHIPLLEVQHHHAHAVSCMVEYQLQERLLAVILDGTGAGTDGTIWGGEFFACDRSTYERLSHFEAVPMPGGDAASSQPWRMAIAYLYHYYGEEMKLPSTFVKRIGASKINLIATMIRQKINTPYTSGAGRLFDAVSSLLGLCDQSSFEAEAPMKLEQLAASEYQEQYPLDTLSHPISFKTLFDGLLQDIEAGINTPRIAAKFHNTLACLVVEKSVCLMRRYSLNKVVLSGGCFQNKRLALQVIEQFAKREISAYYPYRIPCNDSGISVGQVVIAVHQRTHEAR